MSREVAPASIHVPVENKSPEPAHDVQIALLAAKRSHTIVRRPVMAAQSPTKTKNCNA